LFVLLDSRLEPQKLDLDFVNNLGEWQVPFALVFTKADKITQREVAAHVKQFLDALRENWEYLPQHFVTSSEKGTGGKKILDFIAGLNEAYFTQQRTGL
jgi:GTP-binding protein